MNLWFINSGSAAAPEYHSKYDFVKPEQIAWYESRAKETGSLPALLFQHIPVPEEFELFHTVPFWRVVTDAVQGQDERRGTFWALNEGALGYAGEAPCAPSYNSGQFVSWKKTGDVMAAFFGHDHMNDFSGYVDGILLAQCQTSGFQPYGDGIRQAVRVVDLDEKDPKSFQTFLVRYRELCGTHPRSIQGPFRLLHDRQSMALEFGMKLAACLAGAAALSVGCAKIIKHFKV